MAREVLEQVADERVVTREGEAVEHQDRLSAWRVRAVTIHDEVQQEPGERHQVQAKLQELGTFRRCGDDVRGLHAHLGQQPHEDIAERDAPRDRQKPTKPRAGRPLDARRSDVDGDEEQQRDRRA